MTRKVGSDVPITPAMEALSRLPHVTFVGLGLKRVGGAFTERPAVVVEVARKRPLAEVPAAELIPPRVGNLETDIEEPLDGALCRPAQGILPLDRLRVRPLLSGVSIGVSGDHVGSLGFFARRNTDNAPVLVSNYHVLYRGRALLDITGEPHHAFQPPVGSDNKVGEVKDGTIGGTVDCAYAVLDEEGSSCCCRAPIAHENRTRDTGAGDAVQMTGIRRAQVNDLVTKTGRSTGRTLGRVVHVSKTISGAVSYAGFDLPKGDSFNFNDLIMIVTWDPATSSFDDQTAFAAEGDSGAAIVNEAGEIVGLHFMSYHDPASGRRYSFACHIEAVEMALQLTVPGTRQGLGTPAGAPLAALDQDIDTGSGTVVIGGAAFPRSGVAAVAAGLEAILSATEAGRAWQEIFARHQHAVLALVNRRRGVTLAWQRAAGPAWLAAAVRSVSTPGYALPDRIDGVSPADLARGMRAALMRDGSEGLRADLARHGDRILALLAGVRRAEEGVAALAAEAPEREAADA